MNPLAIQVLIIGVVISVASAIVNKKVVDQKRMKEIKDKISAFQKKYNEAKKSGNKELIDSMEPEQKEMMVLTTEMMMGSFKPLLFTFIPILVIFYILNGMYAGTGNIVDVPIIGELGWFWWYFLVAMLSGFSFEAVYKLLTREKK